uniref:Uncharacterized protein n=1 Tax=Timema cristinae TaxID=61476 RepID=A0A7R9GT53_TIMCR|nr:unnamed protein product [Timema cristinae]
MSLHQIQRHKECTSAGAPHNTDGVPLATKLYQNDQKCGSRPNKVEQEVEIHGEKSTGRENELPMTKLLGENLKLCFFLRLQWFQNQQLVDKSGHARRFLHCRTGVEDV